MQSFFSDSNLICHVTAMESLEHKCDKFISVSLWIACSCIHGDGYS